MEGYYFKSEKFKVIPNEDEETNPFCYGKDLAKWLRNQFENKGQYIEEVIAEDWGWCVIIQREPFLLWVGCGCMRSIFYDKYGANEIENFIPDPKDLTWYCFVGSDVNIWNKFYWQKLFGKKKIEPYLENLDMQVKELLEAEESVVFVERP